MKSKYLHLNNLSQSFEGDSVSTPCTAATNADRYSFFEKWNDLKSVKLQPKKTDSQKYGPREKRLYNYLNGEKYDGEWTGHVRSGFGTMNWNDRFIYQG